MSRVLAAVPVAARAAVIKVPAEGQRAPVRRVLAVPARPADRRRLERAALAAALMVEPAAEQAVDLVAILPAAAIRRRMVPV